MFEIDFKVDPENPKDLIAKRKEFGLFQELLRKGFSPKTPDESMVFGDVKKKIRALSEEDGVLCWGCATIKHVPTEAAGQNFTRILIPTGGTLVLENEEHRTITAALKDAPKQGMYDVLEEVLDVIKKFTEAKKTEEKPKDDSAK